MNWICEKIVICCTRLRKVLVYGHLFHFSVIHSIWRAGHNVKKPEDWRRNRTNLLDFIQYLLRSSSRAPLGIPLDLLHSSYWNFSVVLPGISPWIPSQFLQQFLQSSFRSSLRVSQGIPSELSRYFSKNFFRVPQVSERPPGNPLVLPGILPEFLRKFLQGYSRHSWKIFLRVLPGFASKFL